MIKFWRTSVSPLFIVWLENQIINHSFITGENLDKIRLEIQRKDTPISQMDVCTLYSCLLIVWNALQSAGRNLHAQANQTKVQGVFLIATSFSLLYLLWEK